MLPRPTRISRPTPTAPWTPPGASSSRAAWTSTGWMWNWATCGRARSTSHSGINASSHAAGGNGSRPGSGWMARRAARRLASGASSGAALGASPRAIALIVLVGIAVWLASGFYTVKTDEQGVATIFGRWVGTTEPGLNYILPAPIGHV